MFHVEGFTDATMHSRPRTRLLNPTGKELTRTQVERVIRQDLTQKTAQKNPGMNSIHKNARNQSSRRRVPRGQKRAVNGEKQPGMHARTPRLLASNTRSTLSSTAKGSEAIGMPSAAAVSAEVTVGKSGWSAGYATRLRHSRKSFSEIRSERLGRNRASSYMRISAESVTKLRKSTPRVDDSPMACRKARTSVEHGLASFAGLADADEIPRMRSTKSSTAASPQGAVTAWAPRAARA